MGQMCIRDSYALNKADLADPAVTEEWIRYFRAADAGCVAILSLIHICLRNVINKNVTWDEIEKTCTIAFNAGYTSVKLYFMMGLPTETMEDLSLIHI